MTNTYAIPDEIQIGDIIAVNGRGWLSTLIKLFSYGVSHTEIIAHNPETNKLECFSADQHGTRFRSIESVVRNTDGDIYYLRLAPQLRERFLNEEALGEAIIKLNGVPYDFLHFIGVAVDDWHIDWLRIFKKIPKWVISTLKGVFSNSETMAKVVCSGACAWGLKAGFGLSNINASEQMPLDVCRLGLYDTTYYLLKGEDNGISQYNTKTVNLKPKELQNENN